MSNATAPTATARQQAFYKGLVRRLQTAATLDEATAEACIVAFPTYSVAHASTIITVTLDNVRKAEAAVKAQPEVPAAPAGPAIWPGLYTVRTENGHRTFRVELQASDAQFAPGKTVVAYLAGSDNTADYRGFAFLTASGRLKVWAKHKGNSALVNDAFRFLADPAAALTAKHCARCGETLTVPASIEAGFGPVCVKKGFK